MTTSQWLTIDGTIDNEVNIEVVDGDPAVAALGTTIRRAGWAQVAGWTGPGGSGGWPTDDHMVAVEMNEAQWRLVCSALQRWSRVSDELGQTDEAAEQRDARVLVMDQLGDVVSGWSGSRN